MNSVMPSFEQVFAQFRASKLVRKPAEHDEGVLRLARERGQQAERLFADPLLVEAFSTVESHYVTAWRTSAADDIDTRERAWTALQLLGDLRASLLKVAKDGVVAGDALMRSRERR